MEISNISYKEYTQLAGEDVERYVFAVTFGEEFNKPVDTLGIGDLTEQPFIVIKDLQNAENDSLENIFAICKLLIDPNRDILSLFQERAYILESVKQITNVERQTLTNGPINAREQNALYDEEGKNIFEGLDVIIQIDTLSNGDVTKYEDVKNLPWSVCYTKLLLNAKRNQFQRNLAKQMK